MFNKKKFLSYLLFFTFLVNGNHAYSSQNEEEEDISETSQVAPPLSDKKEQERYLGLSDTKGKARENPSNKRSYSTTVVPKTSREQDTQATTKNKKRRISVAIREDYSQVYATPTYDATFKYLMADRDICISFLRAFIPDENITSLEFLDEHLSPFKLYQQARTFLNDTNSKKVVKKINDLLEEREVKEDRFSISFTNAHTPEEQEVFGGGEFIKGLAQIYGDILKGYPQPYRNSQVDLLCQIDRSYYALVEVQVIPQDYWDKRALAYAANIYGRQLSEGQGWDKIKKVICINLLGGGADNTRWSEITGFRQLTFKDQHNTEIEEGIEILQYPLFHDQIREESEVRKRYSEEVKTEYIEWIDFFEKASSKKEDEVEEEVTSIAVKKAYERIKASDLPVGVKEEYEQQEKELFAKYSRHTEYLKKQAEEKGKEEGIKEGIRQTVINMIKQGISSDIITMATKYNSDEIQQLKENLANEGQETTGRGTVDLSATEMQVKQESIEFAMKQGAVGPRLIPGWELHDVEDEGNCFYDAIAHQMQLIKHPFLNEVPSTTLPRDSLRLRLQGVDFKDKEWAEDQHIDQFVKSFNDIILAVVDTRAPENGFTYYYMNVDGEVVTHAPDNKLPLPPKNIIRLAATGNHYLSIVSYPSKN